MQHSEQNDISNTSEPGNPGSVAVNIFLCLLKLLLHGAAFFLVQGNGRQQSGNRQIVLVLSLKCFIPFAVFIHSICSLQFAKLVFIGAGVFKGFTLAHIHLNIVQIGNLEFCQRLGTFRTYHFMAVQHKNAVTSFTVMHVHHNKIPLFCDKTIVVNLSLSLAFLRKKSMTYMVILAVL